jgi:antitoxin component YwqK of YwqJK toxin-antitoxin module
VLDAQTDFFCPDNNKIAYDAWGECGLKKECIDRENGKTDGSKFSAQNGQLQSKAMYEQGRQIGGWTGYDNEGNPLPEDGGYNPSRQQ